MAAGHHAVVQNPKVYANGSTGLLFEIGRILSLLKIGGEIFQDRDMDESRPEGWRLRVYIEVLMLNSFRAKRQKDEVAFFPIPALAVYDRVSFTF